MGSGLRRRGSGKMRLGAKNARLFLNYFDETFRKSAPLSHACWSFPRTREFSFFRVLVFQSGAPRKALDPRLCGDDGEPSRSAPSASDRAVGVSLRDAVACVLVIPANAGI